MMKNDLTKNTNNENKTTKNIEKKKIVIVGCFLVIAIAVIVGVVILISKYVNK